MIKIRCDGTNFVNIIFSFFFINFEKFRKIVTIVTINEHLKKNFITEDAGAVKVLENTHSNVFNLRHKVAKLQQPSSKL